LLAFFRGVLERAGVPSWCLRGEFVVDAGALTPAFSGAEIAPRFQVIF
jgi:hypothetical protein